MAGSELTLCFNSKKDCEILKSQIAASSSNWRNRLVFTEHDTSQTTDLLNSEQANRMTFTNEALSANPTIRDSRIVQNAITPRLCAGVDFYSIGSAIRESLTTAFVNKRFGYPDRVWSVIRKFRNTDFSLNQVNCYDSIEIILE